MPEFRVTIEKLGVEKISAVVEAEDGKAALTSVLGIEVPASYNLEGLLAHLQVAEYPLVCVVEAVDLSQSA